MSSTILNNNLIMDSKATLSPNTHTPTPFHKTTTTKIVAEAVNKNNVVDD